MTERSRGPATPKSCHERALGLLAVRPRSRRELERRLGQAGFDEVEVREVLDRLERVGLVDDDAFARALAEQAFERRGAGAAAVRQALFAKGVAQGTTTAVIAELEGDARARALGLARGHAARMSALAPERAYRRVVGLLARRGHPPSVAHWAARIALGLDPEPD